MASLEGAAMTVKGRKLADIRQFVFELWRQAKTKGGEIKFDEMQKLLSQKFPDRPVAKSTIYGWIFRWRMREMRNKAQIVSSIQETATPQTEEGSKPVGAAMTARGQELADSRRFAFELWSQAKSRGEKIKFREIQELLRRKFPDRTLINGTLQGWLRKWSKGKGLARYEFAKLIQETKAPIAIPTKVITMSEGVEIMIDAFTKAKDYDRISEQLNREINVNAALRNENKQLRDLIKNQTDLENKFKNSQSKVIYGD